MGWNLQCDLHLLIPTVWKRHCAVEGFPRGVMAGGVNRPTAAGGFYSSRSTLLHLFLWNSIFSESDKQGLCRPFVSSPFLLKSFVHSVATRPQLTSPPRCSPVAFFHPHSAPLCSLISCAWKIQPAVLIINKKARLKSAEGTLLRQDPKDLSKELWSFLLSLYSVSFFFAVQKASRARPLRWRWNAEQLWEKKYNPTVWSLHTLSMFTTDEEQMTSLTKASSDTSA